jgi:transcriptional regulator with XRE-family HTH domain
MRVPVQEMRQSKLAAAMGVSQGQVSHYERGITAITVETAFRHLQQRRIREAGVTVLPGLAQQMQCRGIHPVVVRCQMIGLGIIV